MAPTLLVVRVDRIYAGSKSSDPGHHAHARNLMPSEPDFAPTTSGQVFVSSNLLRHEVRYHNRMQNVKQTNESYKNPHA